MHIDYLELNTVQLANFTNTIIQKNKKHCDAQYLFQQTGL